MHILTRAEEEVLFKTLKANALKECDPIVKQFVECTHGKLVTVLWACRKQHRAMNDCLMALTTQADMDKLKIQYLNDLAEGKVDHAQIQREQKQKEEELKRKSKSNAPGVH
ncbi:COX assembly mitochondrial protein 1 [Entomortierella parvispora]|uniref:COX assembly mitochondrial protein n=1 Tax=Entomortierella parvispora TaxID=205924 RepID=A0A9P3LS78_9FUNG|nr:COX assembly mitochondrial protein 1 [Entomortierella parvispora]